MKVITILGARPQFIKAKPLSDIIKNDFEEIIIHTGQHYDKKMSDVFFEELELPNPKYNLGIGSGNHGQQTGLMIQKIEEVLLYEKPSFVIVYGDTNSTLAGALSAAKLHIPVVHIEAGLRSFNKKMPEEINRIMTDHISELLFVPSNKALEQCYKEGLEKGVFNVGDIMYDTILKFLPLSEARSNIINELSLDLKKFYTATIHRPENTDSKIKLSIIFESLSELDSLIIMPIHPRTMNKIKEYNIKISKNIKLIEPLGYFDMLKLLSRSSLIFTDSGGLQKEAYYLKKFCITLRDETEWTETLETGNNILVPIVKDKIVNSISLFKEGNLFPNIYGNGNSSSIILSNLIKYFK